MIIWLHASVIAGKNRVVVSLAGAIRSMFKLSWPWNSVHLASPTTRVWSVIQFTSQVLPPSSENDCSKCGEFEVISDQINRTRIALPFGPDVSVSKNSPLPFLNSPIVGAPTVPLLLVAQ